MQNKSKEKCFILNVYQINNQGSSASAYITPDLLTGKLELQFSASFILWFRHLMCNKTKQQRYASESQNLYLSDKK